MGIRILFILPFLYVAGYNFSVLIWFDVAINWTVVASPGKLLGYFVQMTPPANSTRGWCPSLRPSYITWRVNKFVFAPQFSNILRIATYYLCQSYIIDHKLCLSYIICDSLLLSITKYQTNCVMTQSYINFSKMGTRWTARWRDVTLR